MRKISSVTFQRVIEQRTYPLSLCKEGNPYFAQTLFPGLKASAFRALKADGSRRHIDDAKRRSSGSTEPRERVSVSGCSSSAGSLTRGAGRLSIL